MTVAAASVADVEQNSERVEQPARYQPRNPARRDVEQERTQRYDRQPTHTEVHSGRECRKPRTERAFEGHTRYRKPPHDAEQGPPPRPPQGDESERRVGPRDEQINRGVIESAKKFFGSRPAEGVIQC